MIKSCAAFYAALHLEYFVKVNLQLYLASAFTFSIFFYMNHLISYCSNVWTFLLTCKFDAFCNYTVVLKLYVCRVPYSYIAPDLFYYLDWSCLLEAAFGDLILSLINRSMKLIGKKKNLEFTSSQDFKVCVIVCNRHSPIIKWKNYATHKHY